MESANEYASPKSGKKSKSSSSKKKKGQKKPSSSELEELKRRGRHLRSSQKEGGLHGLNEGLTMECLSQQPQGVGLVYDERMLEYKCTWDNHHERPERISKVYERCQHYGLVERCVKMQAREATEDELLLCHTKEYVNQIESSASMAEEQLKEISSKFDGIYFHNKTWEAAKLSLGSTIDIVDQVWNEELRSGMNIIRPPGHHAMKNEACGYCFFNNVASAAKHAVDNLGVKRVLILDWDVHHGQGTQYTFYDDPRVLNFSIHRYDHGLFWPNLESGGHTFIGEGRGVGYNVNVSVNQTGMTNGDYMAVMQQLLMPIAYEFSPELILVSAGYDSAVGCPEGEMEVTPGMFAHFINLLKPLANGKLCVIQEGGYCLKSLAEGSAMTLRALLGDPVPEVGPLDPPCDSMVASILKCISVLRPHWENLKFQGEGEDMPEIVIDQKIPENVQFSTPHNQPEKFDIVGDFIDHSPEKAAQLDKEIDSIIAATKLRNPPNRTCLVYDEAMRAHKSVSMPGHPERPDRIKRIYEKHKDCGLLDKCKHLQSRKASKSEITALHGPAYFDTVESYKKMDQRELNEEEGKYNSIFINPDSFDCALMAVGCTLSVVDEVCSGQSQNGVCIVRPPGHHAEVHSAMGFCFFNTAAIAAKYAQMKHGAKRVLILDWDVHHGNGTQHMFYDDPSVLYVSLHRYDNGWFFPSGEDGDFYMAGEGKGLGHNVNIPWNSCHTGDAEYIAAFQQIVMPIAYEYCPDLVIVSAGFDAARGDPLGGLDISPEGYGHMTQMLLGLAGGKLVMVLEGGYNLNSISESMAMCTSVMLGDLVPGVMFPTPAEHAVDSIRRVLSVHQHHWKSLRFYVDLPVKEMKKVENVASKCKAIREDLVHIPREENPDIDYHKLLTGPYDGYLKQIERKTGAKLTLHYDDGMKLSNVHISGEDGEGMAEAAEKVKNIIYSAGGGDADTKVKDEVDDLSTSIGSMNVSENSGDASRNFSGDFDVSKTSENIADEAGLAGSASPEGAMASGVAAGGRSLVNAGNGVLETSGIIDQEAREFLGKAAEGMENLQMHAVVPLAWCRHLEFSEQMLNPVPEAGLNHLDPCLECGNVGENWVCLNCYEVHCSRYVNEHMLFHGIETGHKLVLSYADLSVWCYGCDNYVHNQMLLPHKRAAHISKFDEDIPNH